MKKSFLEIACWAKGLLLVATTAFVALAALTHFGGGVGELACGLGLAACSLAALGVLRSALCADGSRARWVVSVLMLIALLGVVVDVAFALAGGTMPADGAWLQAAKWGVNFRVNSTIVTIVLTLTLSFLLVRDYRGWLRAAGIMLLAAPIVGWGSDLITQEVQLVGNGLSDASQRMVLRMVAKTVRFLCHIAPMLMLCGALRAKNLEQ